MKFYLRRVPLNQGGYEYGKHGQYWGVGMPLYHYESTCLDYRNGTGTEGELRAWSREEAKAKIEVLFPGATFFN